ncbi:zinc finger domain-containing protein [Candidatus Nitrososphaera gargensis Ga9.2]|uniref:Zinc finger domain-containing protein n=2 Tax=Candidatus Nitrososphaera gargensis TaxID=497727 RepID=K0IMB2_NITGG|nr:zinc finger domain-containing protein [Candidatus Nitrososphaera gargensis Ga9.2]
MAKCEASAEVMGTDHKRKENQQPIVMMLTDQQDIIDRLTRIFVNADSEICACIESETPIATTDIESLVKAKLAARKRGVKLRYITEIKEGNLYYCRKQIGMITELRHLDFVKGNFVVSDKEFLSVPLIPEEGPVTEGIYTDVDAIVLQQQLIFETLWKKARPAEERIRELERRYNSQEKFVEEENNKKQQKIIDRIYLCMKCGASFIYRGEALQHVSETGHDETREFPFGNSI